MVPLQAKEGFERLIGNMIHHGDCLTILKGIASNSIDSMVTDPPAGISFMGKEWDSAQAFKINMVRIFTECLRVLKPGAHALVWAIPRTSHWTATALEDAGFEIRDVITHLFGSGFPKSLDISKAIDKAAGAEREVKKVPFSNQQLMCKDGQNERPWMHKAKEKGFHELPGDEPATAESKLWQGFGTALKPASEHWILCRKPLSEKTVAANVLKWGVGGINIDGCRIGSQAMPSGGSIPDIRANSYEKTEQIMKQGRFPANLVLSHNEDCEETCTPGCAVAMLDEQSGTLTSGKIE